MAGNILYGSKGLKNTGWHKTKIEIEMKTTEEKELIDQLAERIKILFSFCFGFVPELDLLKETLLGIKDKENFTMSAAPLLGAFGVDYEQKNFEWRMKRKRAEALINLIEVLDRTEKERAEMSQKKANMADIVKQFNL